MCEWARSSSSSSTAVIAVIIRVTLRFVSFFLAMMLNWHLHATICFASKRNRFRTTQWLLCTVWVLLQSIDFGTDDQSICKLFKYLYIFVEQKVDHDYCVDSKQMTDTHKTIGSDLIDFCPYLLAQLIHLKCIQTSNSEWIFSFLGASVSFTKKEGTARGIVS